MTSRQRSAAVHAGHRGPDRDLALDLVRATEAAALAAGRWVGRGDMQQADEAAWTPYGTCLYGHPQPV